MTEIVLTGQSGETLLFDGKDVILSELKTGPAKASHTVGRVVDSWGTAITASALGPRQVTIRGVFLASGDTEEERYSSLREWRHRLCRITAPETAFTLERDGYSIRLVADGVPEFSTDPALTGPDASGFTLAATAPDPRFLSAAEDFLSLSVSGKNLVFPVAFPEGGFTFGSVTEQDRLPVVNRGDVTVGGVITVRAMATLSAFSITKEESGETFSLLTPLSSGESMILDTRQGRLRVKFVSPDGTESEDFTRVKWDSAFFRFPAGSSTLTWNTGGASDLVRLTVRLYPAYLSL